MKSTIPDTRNSLILRLPDKQDVQAWDQFVDIYQPLSGTVVLIVG